VDRLQRFRDAHFGLFVHWGSYSLKGFEASWPLVWGEISYEEYAALAREFNPTKYDPTEWAALAKAAGMRYVVLTTKHHDGYALFDTALSDYSAPKTAPGRDLVREYVDAVRAAGLMIGFYFSLCDWYHPDYPAKTLRPHMDRHPQAVPPGAPESIEADPARWARYLEFMHGQVRELLTNYGTIDYVFFDGQWEHTAKEWKAEELLAMMHELQPEIVVNDRLNAPGRLGDIGTPEQYVPVAGWDRPWETNMTINETWAYNPKDRAYKPARELVATLAEVSAKGGNFLLNVGPTPEGEIPVEFASRLRVVGEWMERNGESIFAPGAGLPPGSFYGPTTGGDDAVYIHVLGRPGGDQVLVRGMEGRRVAEATLLSDGRALEFDLHRGHLEQGAVRVVLPDAWLDPLDTVVKLRFEG